jgi:hypothetical protein
MTKEQLEARFADRGVPYAGGLLILRPDDALALVHSAEEARIPILGVDGFRISATETVGPLEHLADFSKSVDATHGCWREAEAFIVSRRTLSLDFEVTLGQSVPSLCQRALRLTNTTSHVLFLSSQMAHFIPKSAFASDVELQQLRAFVRARVPERRTSHAAA